MNGVLDKTYFIIGVGNIGKALATRLCDLGVSGSRFLFYDINEEHGRGTANQFGARVSPSIEAGAPKADIVVIATPPLTVLSVLEKLSPALKPGQIVISMAAANPLASMRELVGPGVDLVRILPNPPIALGLGMDPVAYEDEISLNGRMFIEALLKALGETVVVRDDQMNWCVGLSGASLRTLLPVVEGMALAGVEAGLSPEDSRRIAAQVMVGTARLILESKLSFEELKALTPMQTLDEVEMRDRFLEVARKTKEKVDGTMAKILAN